MSPFRGCRWSYVEVWRNRVVAGDSDRGGLKNTSFRGLEANSEVHVIGWADRQRRDRICKHREVGRTGRGGNAVDDQVSITNVEDSYGQELRLAANGSEEQIVLQVNSDGRSRRHDVHIDRIGRDSVGDNLEC